MRKIKNPYITSPTYNCFACAPNNPHGLHMQFLLQDDEVVSYWEPSPHFNGYGNILHGGIQTTLMDEIAAWAVAVLVKTAGVTARIDASFKKALHSDKGALKITASLKQMKRSIAVIHTAIYNNAGELCTDADVYYYTLPEEKAKKELFYPGYENFFEAE